MHVLLGILAIIVGVPIIVALGQWQIRSTRPNWTKINARRRSQGKPPIDPS